MARLGDRLLNWLLNVLEHGIVISIRVFGSLSYDDSVLEIVPLEVEA